jgi:hypothetical protein
MGHDRALTGGREATRCGPDERHETRPYLKVRRAYVDVLDAGRRKNLMHGLLHLKVTEARRLLARPGDGTAPLSFTGWVLP